jgi:hypothetical protein
MQNFPKPGQGPLWSFAALHFPETTPNAARQPCSAFEIHSGSAEYGGLSILYGPRPHSATLACGTSYSRVCPDGVSRQTPRRGSSGTSPIVARPFGNAWLFVRVMTAHTPHLVTRFRLHTLSDSASTWLSARIFSGGVPLEENNECSPTIDRPAETDRGACPVVRRPPFPRSDTPCKSRRAVPRPTLPDLLSAPFLSDVLRPRHGIVRM